MDNEFRQWLKNLIVEESLSLEDLFEKYPEQDPWSLRTLFAETRREARDKDAYVPEKAPTFSKKGLEAIQAGWLKPVNLNFNTLPPLAPNANKSGRVIGIISDLHYPVHDPRAIDVMFQIGRYVGLDELIINGDLFDCASLSRFTPSAEQHIRWVDERKEALSEMVKIRQNFPDIRIRFVPGNHDERPMKWINANAIPLQGLFDLEDLLSLQDLGFEFVTDGKIFLAEGNLLVKHGVSIAASSGSSVKKELEKAGCSVIMGHVHRRALIEVTTASYELTGVELGCLCDVNADYLPVEETANWQQGFAIVNEYEDGEFDIELVKISNGKAGFRGIQFTSRI